MKIPILAVVVTAWLACGLLAATDVPTFGRAGEKLRTEDVSAITSVAGDLLAIEAHRGQVLPETWTALAYLKPDSTVNGVRQGRLVVLESAVQDDRAVGWRIKSRGGRYAQVAASGREFPNGIASTDLHRPFEVIGAFTPAQLLELVEFVRSSPRKPPIPDDPDGTSHVEGPGGIRGHLPLVRLERINQSTVTVLLADNFYSGEHAELHYRGGRWQLGRISWYIV